MRVLPHAAAVLVALAATTSTVRAGESTTVAVVRVTSPADAELLDRVRGQTVDLDVQLVVVPAPALEPTLPEQLAAARRLAVQRGARVVIWFRAAGATGGKETTVFVAEPGADRVLVRRIAGGDAGDLSGSAAREAAALVVRASLRAIAAGGSIGIETPREAPPAPAPEVVAPPPASPSPAGPRTRVDLAAGGQGALVDGEGVGHFGVVARVGLARGRWGVDLGGALGLDADYRDALTVIRVARSRALVSAAYQLPRVPIWIAAGAGVMVLSRTTEAIGSGVMATPATRTWLPVIAPEVRARLRPGGGPLALELEAGLDLLPVVPQLDYQLDGQRQVRDRMWPVAPRIGLMVTLEAR